MKKVATPTPFNEGSHPATETASATAVCVDKHAIPYYLLCVNLSVQIYQCFPSAALTIIHASPTISI